MEIERRPILGASEIVCFTTPEQPEYQIVGGIRFYLNLIPREDEKGHSHPPQNGKPIVEPLGTYSALLTDAGTSFDKVDTST